MTTAPATPASTPTAPVQTLEEVVSMHGTRVAVEADSPIPLIDPGAVMFVAAGHLDVVATTIVRLEPRTDMTRTHLFRVDAGKIFFGLDAPATASNVLILGFAPVAARIYRIPLQRLATLAHEPEHRAAIAGMIDHWVAGLCTLLGVEVAPTGALNLRAGTLTSLRPGQAAQPQAGVLWIRHESGSTRLLGTESPAPWGGECAFPVGKDAWLVASEECTLTAQRGVHVITEPAYWSGLSRFNASLESLIDVQRMRERETARERLVTKSRSERATIEAAITELKSTLAGETSRVGGAEDGLRAACRMIGARLGIAIRDTLVSERRSVVVNPLERIAKSSRFRVRRVTLNDGWWKRDCGPLLGFLAEAGAPVALLPAGTAAYVLHDPSDGTERPLTPAVAATLGPTAFTFCRTLPEASLRGLDLVSFAAHGLGRDLLAVALMGLCGGLIALATPLAIGHVFDTVIPASNRTQLIQMALGLGVAALAAAAFQITRNIALIRIENRAGPALQAAVWDRLLNLPARFFTRYTAGDLATRAMGVEAIQSALSNNAITAVVSGLFSMFSLALLFYLSPIAAGAASAMCLIVVAVVMLCGYLQYLCQRPLQERAGKMAGMLLQFINGIAKIRVAAAEERAFGQWAAKFAEITRLRLRARAIANSLSVFIASFPLLAVMLIYYFVAHRSAENAASVSTGEFLAFMAAFSSFLSGLLELGNVAVSVINVAPTYERLRPIVEATPEVDHSKADPGVLRGRIEIANVSFRYSKEDPLTLDRVNLHADPGEFVALVGPSGSGKSTLLRILLGFETPESGSLFFDGFDAQGLDVHALRRQCGVVLQDGALLPGDIFGNIVGSNIDLTLDDAWRAARMAGLDRDIEQMPMGMHTVLSEGASTISGGQRQRLLIARALVTRPRVVFFDEATSALDNPTQAIVTESLDRLNATRIVIAHRLSTIINADRIYVLEQGRVVQSGVYQELVEAPGPFSDMARRQIA